MATTTPKAETILAQVKTTLELIVTPTYRNDVQQVDRQFINPEKFGGTKIPAIAIFGTRIEREPGTIGLTPCENITLSFQVQGIIKAYSNPQSEILKFVEDVTEVLYADRSRGGNADNTLILETVLGGASVGGNFGEPPFVREPFIGFLMDCQITYQEAK